MSAANVSRNRLSNLPEELQVAQNAINLPEVKEILKKLSQHNLGIYMPHMHDEETGAFKPLPPGITQVEDGLVVSFRPNNECQGQGDNSYLSVGWFLHPDMPDEASVAASCRQVCKYNDRGLHETRCADGPND
jgi:hypothetical protein